MILQALSGYYDRLSERADGSIAPPGYSYQAISFAVLLSADGVVVDIQDLRQVEDKKARAISLLVPQPPKRSGRNPPPAFMSDKAGYVFGVQRDKVDKTKTVENIEYQAAFRAYHEQLLADVDDEGCRALLQFLAQWKPAQFPALRHADELADGNVVFRLDGVRGYLHERPAIRRVWDAQGATTLARLGMCLISGEQRPVARLHPSIKGVRGAQSSGASIVSFNQDSFASYGKSQGDNAPVSEQATFAYTTALNALLAQSSRQKVQIGDATTVYWAEADTAEVAISAETAAQLLFAPSSPADTDTSETARLRRGVMDLIAKGRPLKSPELRLDPGTRFYILGLAPNAARLSVRFWEMTTLGALGKAFYQHWQDLQLETRLPPKPPPALAALALQTAPARKSATGDVKPSFDDVSPLLAGELTRAVLSGGRYPGSLLSTLVMRIRTDGYLGRLRIPLIKACLVRSMRLEDPTLPEDYLVRSDPNETNQAILLGRLFALFERAQRNALGERINSTITDKFIGAAAATPASVFVGLEKNSHNHTRRLERGHSDAKWIREASNPAKLASSVGHALRRDIGQIWMSFHGALPAQQSIEDQGLFFIGYYQERFGPVKDRHEDGDPNPTSSDEVTEVNTDDQE